jgi:hypothetical protein
MSGFHSEPTTCASLCFRIESRAAILTLLAQLDNIGRFIIMKTSAAKRVPLSIK